MLLTNIVIPLLSLKLVTGQNRCSQANIKTRKNILNFSSEELRKWLDVTKKFSKTERFNELSKIHNDYTGYVHGTELFLPWHRKFVATYEEELLNIDSSVVMPFIDWTTSSKKPHQHPVLQDSMYGGNGNKNNNWCLDSGTFAGTNVTTPSRKCLQRKYDLNDNTELSPFSSKEEVQSSIDRNDKYSDFRSSIQGNIHNLPHNRIGSGGFDMGQLYSPNDPLFYLHHTFIDNMWFQWQSKKESRFDEYNSNDGTVSKNDKLVALSGVVGDVLDPRKGSLCYKYETWGTDIKSSLKKSSAIESNDRSLSFDQQENIWDKIKAIPFDKEADKILNIEEPSSRTSKCLISKPGKLSPEFLKMMNIDYAKYEKNRMMSVKVIDMLNADPEYEPAEGC